MDRRTFLRAGASLAVVSAVAACMKKPAPVAPKVELGPWGVELQNRNLAIKPGDDFFRYVNGGWIDKTAIPADKASYGAFDYVYDNAEKQVRAIIEEAAAAKGAAGTIEKKIGDYYAAFMDEAGVAAKGAAPLKPSLDAIAAAANKSALCALFGTSGYPSPIDTYVNVDSKNSERYLLNITQGGLGMPNRDYYLQPKFKDQAAKYKAYLQQLFTLAGFTDPAGRVGRAYGLELRIAQAHWPLADQRDAIKTYNLVNVSALGTTGPGFDWAKFLTAMGAGDLQQVSLNEKTALTKIAGLVALQPLDV